MTEYKSNLGFRLPFFMHTYFLLFIICISERSGTLPLRPRLSSPLARRVFICSVIGFVGLLLIDKEDIEFIFLGRVERGEERREVKAAADGGGILQV